MPRIFKIKRRFGKRPHGSNFPKFPPEATFLQNESAKRGKIEKIINSQKVEPHIVPKVAFGPRRLPKKFQVNTLFISGEKNF